MSVKLTYKTKKTTSITTAKKKYTRLIRSSSSNFVKVLSVEGQTEHGCKSVKFTFISPFQQSKERNKAYTYFSID